MHRNIDISQITKVVFREKPLFSLIKCPKTCTKNPNFFSHVSLPEKKGQQTINTSKNFLVVLVQRGRKNHPLEFSIRSWVEKFPREVVFIRAQNNSIEKMAVMTSEGGRTQ